MPKSWLPPDPGPAEPPIRDWWRPKPLTAGGTEPAWEELAYVVVDELHAGVAGLVASPWPVVDERGRIRFGSEQESIRLERGEGELREQLARDRTPLPGTEIDDETAEQLKTRELAIGDVFAIRFRRGGRFGKVRGPILDVTTEAREVAKAQAAATAAGVVDERLLDEIAGEIEPEGDVDPAARARRPSEERRPKPASRADRERIRRSRADVVDVLREHAEEPG